MKKNNRQLVVKIDELPYRSVDLGYSKLHDIYGGCLGGLSHCKENSECCNFNCFTFYCKI